ncbi:hypothetical protein [Enterococcus rivorum]|uniref:Uncharacterized protein n=1 Tax=Enterococcus rivorum TaxID=762845 RepID=A0A1E5KUR0_9ENTE|nr:hypothetical protein [Enterococcus rivorum]MBP2100443.1 hypothetical protein [Enterococcus rivorum]OEH81604.1 hypothetical protein BCR26_16145 [Enterococcus rivorum]
MIEPILTAISAIITLVTTILGIFEEKKSIEKKEKSINDQDQNFNNITTQGNNSAININATQIQQSVVVKNHQEYKIKDEKFKENLTRLKGYNKFFLIMFPVVMFVLAYFKKIESINYAIRISIIVVCSYSISLYLRYVYQRYVRKIKNRGHEEDILSKIIRGVEFFLFPLVIFLISVINIGGSILQSSAKTSNLDSIYIFIVVYLISAYVESLIFQFVVGNNIWKISFFIKRMLVVVLLLFFLMLLQLLIQDL